MSLYGGRFCSKNFFTQCLAGYFLRAGEADEHILMHGTPHLLQPVIVLRLVETFLVAVEEFVGDFVLLAINFDGDVRAYHDAVYVQGLTAHGDGIVLKHGVGGEHLDEDEV